MSLCLWLSGINFGASGFSDAEQLVSPCCHFCISKEVQSSTRAHFCSVLKILWSFSHMSWWLSLTLFHWVSVQRLLLLIPSSGTSYGQFIQTPHLCLAMRYSPQRLYPRLSHTLYPWTILPKWSQILGTLWSSCHSSTYQTNGGPGGAGKTGRFLLFLFRTGPGSSHQNQFRCVLVTPSRAGFNPYLNFWGADMRLLGLMMDRWTFGGVLSLSLWGDV